MDVGLLERGSIPFVKFLAAVPRGVGSRGPEPGSLLQLADAVAVSGGLLEFLASLSSGMLDLSAAVHGSLMDPLGGRLGVDVVLLASEARREHISRHLGSVVDPSGG